MTKASNQFRGFLYLFSCLWECALQIHFLQYGELFAEGFEAFQVELFGEDAGFTIWGNGGKAEGIDDAGAAAVLAIRVFADAIHPKHIALVLDGTGCEQHFPSMHPHRRPGGYTDEDFVVVPAPQPKRETQVVACGEMEAQASPLDRNILAARRVVLRLATIRKEVMLVVKLNSPSQILP